MAEILPAEKDYIKNIELKLLEIREMLEICNAMKSNIETDLLMKVQQEADRRSAEGDKSLSNDAKRKAYYQELLATSEQNSKNESQIATFVHDQRLLEIELGYQKRKFYREMSKIVAVVQEVSA